MAKKTKTVSLMSVAHITVQYSNITGQPLGTVIDQVTEAIMGSGNDDILDIMMAQIQAASNNITERPMGTSLKAAGIYLLYNEARKLVGRKTIFRLGNWRLST